MAAEDSFAWTLNARRQTLTAQALRAAAADKRVAELECELDQAREQLTHQQNRAASLETSLTLKSDENSRLSDRAAELSADLRRKHDELERARLALATVEAERISLEKSFALKSDENTRLSRRVSEFSADFQLKNDQLERASRTLAAAESDRIAADERNRADISTRDHKLAVASTRAESAEKLLDEVQQRLRTSESEIERLRRERAESSAELMRRDTALASAEHTIASLGNLFWQLESAVQRQWRERQSSDATPQSIVAECRNDASFSSGILERDLGTDAWLFETLLNRRA